MNVQKEMLNEANPHMWFRLLRNMLMCVSGFSLCANATTSSYVLSPTQTSYEHLVRGGANVDNLVNNYTVQVPEGYRAKVFLKSVPDKSPLVHCESGTVRYLVDGVAKSVNTTNTFTSTGTISLSATASNPSVSWTEMYVDYYTTVAGVQTPHYAHRYHYYETYYNDYCYIITVHYTCPVAVSFNTNGGGAIADKTYWTGEEYGTLPTPTRSGYKFVGWYSNASLTQRIYATSTVNESVTALYAKWAEYRSVSFNTTGGNSLAAQAFVVGETYGELPTPTRAGHTFSGWYSDDSLTTRVTANSIVADSVTMLYAKWVDSSTLLLSPISSSVGWSLTTNTISITTPFAWEAQSDVDWITILSSEGSGNGTIVYVVAPNRLVSSRTGTITVYALEHAVVCTVAQEEGTPDLYTLNRNRYEFADDGGSGTITLTWGNPPVPGSNSKLDALLYGWEATSDSSWITITDRRSVKWGASGSVTFTVARNSTGKPRSGVISLEGLTVRDGSYNIVVVQGRTLDYLDIIGFSDVESNGGASYICTATMNDGTTRSVTPTWSIASGDAYASISSDGRLTAKNTTTSEQFVTVKATYTEGGVTRTATKAVTIAASLSVASISISGNSSVASGGSAAYFCTATMSDGSVKTIAPEWSIVSGYEYASISDSGVLNAMATDVDRTVLLLAIYAESGAIKTVSKTVTIVAPITTCEITFDANGGAGGKTFASVPIGSMLGYYMDLVFPKCEVDGCSYEFDGWWTAESGGTLVTATTVVTSNATYYAHWKKGDAYTVRYRKYDGSGETAEEFLECGKTYRLAWMDSQLGWMRPGYEFCGWVPWNPDTKPRLCKYVNGQPVKDLAKSGETIELYCGWKSSSSYRVCFHRCAGPDDLEKMNQVILRNKESNLAWMDSQIGWTREGYTFKGWSEKEDSSSVKYANGAKVKNLAMDGGTKHLYAVWSAKDDHKYPYTVKYYKYDGSGETCTQSFKAGTVQSLAWLDSQLGWSRPGYEFVGWVPWNPDTKPRLCKYVNGQKVVDLASKLGEVVSLYPAWKSSSSYRVCFNRNDGTGVKMNQVILRNKEDTLAWMDSQIGWKREGYVFKGWAETASGAVKYANGAKVKNLAMDGGTKHLYAIWRVAD